MMSGESNPVLATSVLDSVPANLQDIIGKLLVAYPPAEAAIKALVAHYESAQEPLLKRQKLMGSSASAASSLEDAGKCVFFIKQLSFVTPRKRLDLRLFKKHLGLFNSTNNTVEASAALADIHTIICVPTPSKMKPHFTISMLLSSSSNPSSVTPSSASDAFVFGFEADGNSIAICDENNRNLAAPGSGFRDTYDAIKFVLKKSTGREIVEPNPATFKSSKSTNTQPVFHLDCHLGTKEG